MKIRKIMGSVAWFMLAAALVVFNATAVEAQVLKPHESQEAYTLSCEF